MYKRIFTFIESLGVGILIFVLLGLTKAPWSVINATTSRYCFFIIEIMIVSIVVAIIQSIQKIVSGKPYVTYAVWFSLVLFFAAVNMFFIHTNFFMLALQYHWNNYWVLVSYYSLPAIMLEGGLFTYFQYQIHTSSSVFISAREKKMFTIGIVAYLFFAISLNFLAISQVISISHQVNFSRMVLIVSSALFILLRVRKS